jgi:hypothetical protein
MPRWMPLQRMHTKTPMFHEAQRGCLLTLQSAQDLLDSSLTSCLSVARFCSVRSGPEGVLRDIVVVCGRVLMWRLDWSPFVGIYS